MDGTRTFTADEIATRLEQLRARKCPCGEPVRRYVFASILLPYEGNADIAVREADAAGCDRSFWFSRFMDDVSFSCILLSSLCQTCGRAELWRCDALDVAAMVTAAGTGKGPTIEAVHHDETLHAIMEAVGRETKLGIGVSRLLDNLRKNGKKDG